MTCFDDMERQDVDYKVDGGLLKNFKTSGLQVIVKLASIELTPESPDFPVGGWHVSSVCFSTGVPARYLPRPFPIDRRTNERTHLRHRLVLPGQ